LHSFVLFFVLGLLLFVIQYFSQGAEDQAEEVLFGLGGKWREQRGRFCSGLRRKLIGGVEPFVLCLCFGGSFIGCCRLQGFSGCS
jgi:hypothetical protein